MTTPQMDLAETIDFWQHEVDRDNADPRERTRDGIASSTLHWLRELEALKADASTAPPNEFAPDTVSPPSETLRELMADRGWTRPTLADRMSVTAGFVDAMMHDQYEYVPWLCAALETATGVSAAFWRRRWEQWAARKVVAE